MYISNIVRLDLFETKVGVLTYQCMKNNEGNTFEIHFIETCGVTTASLKFRGHLPNFAYY